MLALLSTLCASELPFPAGYREWVFLSSGLGMSYTSEQASGDPSFDNVFAQPSAYRSFLRDGKWPAGTVLVLEVRGSRSHGSINQSGHFQDRVQDIEAEVKDASGQWTFYSFGDSQSTGRPYPRIAPC
jgi:hypothetical protein